jgi:hypothetical protein
MYCVEKSSSASSYLTRKDGNPNISISKYLVPSKFLKGRRKDTRICVLQKES